MARPKNGTSRVLRTSRWLLALTIGLILYASFYPFDWSWQRLSTAQNGGFPTSLPFGQLLRSDVVANLLFYIPLGGLLMAVRRPHSPDWRHVLHAVALGAALSVAVEYLQYGIPARTPSLTDTSLNAISTGIGAWGYVLVQRLLGLPQLRQRAFDPALYLILAAWLAFHAAPFMPNLRFSQLRNSLQSVLEMQWTLGGVARFLAGYLILSTALRVLLNREHFWLVFTALVALSLFSRSFVVGQYLSFDELLGLLLALPLIGLLRKTPHRQASVPILLVVIACWLTYGLAPFDFVNRAEAFNWMPFRGFLDNDVERGYLLFFEKSFLYLGVTWLIVTAGGTTRFAALLAVTVAIFIEFAQRYLPGRIAEVTDPLLVLAAALLVGIGAVLRRANEPSRSRSQYGRH